jgi:hypothetical protein
VILEAIAFGKVKWRGSEAVQVASGRIAVVEVHMDPLNAAPQALAGQDMRVAAGTRVSLNGSGSLDADGDSLLYAWTAPSSISLSDSSSSRPTFVAPGPGSYTVSLRVTDGIATSDPSEIAVRVNTPPQARAGPDISVREGGLIQLNGAGSVDADDDPLTYLWTASTELGLATGDKPSFSIPSAPPGRFVVVLTANDGLEPSDPDTVEISVAANNVPVADADDDLHLDVGDTQPPRRIGSGSPGLSCWPASFWLTLCSAPAAAPA